MTHYFYIPCYNEQASKDTLSRNVSLIFKYFVDSCIVFSDNKSEDYTLAMLENLQKQHGESIKIYKQPRNVGYANNLTNFQQIPDESIITLLSANDLLHPRGVKYLADTIKTYPDASVYIANWAYYTKKEKPLQSIIYRGDIQEHFVAASLNEYFHNHTYLPNGLSQYTGRKEIIEEIITYAKRGFSNPQLGILTSRRVKNIVALSNPPLILAKHVENSGWRESKENIVRTHQSICDEVILLLQDARERGSLEQTVYHRIAKEYLKTPILTFYNRWGTWTALHGDQKDMIVSLMRSLFALIPRTDYRLKVFLILFLMKCQAGHVIALCRHLFTDCLLEAIVVCRLVWRPLIMPPKS